MSNAETLAADTMVARAADLVEGLSSGDPNVRLKSVRQIKNAVIGNKSKKVCFIKAGALPRILQLLLQERDSEVLVQSATTLGSLGRLPSGLDQLIQNAGIDGLVGTLSSPDLKVVEAGIRALKMVYSQVARVPSHV